MKILVRAKRVVDPDMKIIVKPDGSGIERSSVSFKLNPFDEIAVEEALRIREEHGGEVVAVSVGEPASLTELRVALAMGADRGILVVTEHPVDADLTARALVRVVEKEKPDVMMLGKQAIDFDEAGVSQMMAEYLGWGQACFASCVSIEEGKAVVHREVDGGIEIVEVRLPGIISADLRLNEPRYPKVSDVLKADRKKVDQIPLAEMDIDPAPKVMIRGMSQAPGRKGGRLVEDVGELIRAMKEEAKVL